MPFLYVNDALTQVGLDASHSSFRRTMMRRWYRLVAQRRRIARYTRELQAYSNRELAELGLDRSDIPAVARGTYRRG